jgi:hypothetical protein
MWQRKASNCGYWIIGDAYALLRRARALAYLLAFPLNDDAKMKP